MKFGLGNIVVVEGDKTGVLVKSWSFDNRITFEHEVYVLSTEEIKMYPEKDIKHYRYQHDAPPGVHVHE